MKTIFFLFTSLCTLLACSCGSEKNDITLTPGAVFSIDNGEGGYSVAKILAADDSFVHLRVYKGFHRQRPKSISDKDLQPGSMYDPEGMGIGHIPITRAEFESWHPKFIVQQSVTNEELEGYNIWKEQY